MQLKDRISDLRIWIAYNLFNMALWICPGEDKEKSKKLKLVMLEYFLTSALNKEIKKVR